MKPVKTKAYKLNQTATAFTSLSLGEQHEINNKSNHTSIVRKWEATDVFNEASLESYLAWIFFCHWMKTPQKIHL